MPDLHRKTRNPPIMEVLDGRRRQKRFSIEAICTRVGMTPSTYYRRIKKPDELTVGELTALCGVLGQTPEEIMREASGA